MSLVMGTFSSQGRHGEYATSTATLTIESQPFKFTVHLFAQFSDLSNVEVNVNWTFINIDLRQ